VSKQLTSMNDAAKGSIAILSDVHGNAEAFEAVLADIQARGIPQIFNLGDVVGYGPDPERCIDLAVEHCRLTLCGNHEYAVLHGAKGFNPVAYRAVEFVRERLEPKPAASTESAVRRRWEFLQGLPSTYEYNGYALMHGSPRHPVMEYILPSDPEIDPLKIDDIFDCMPHPLVFVGHTHFPGVLEEGSGLFLTADLLQGRYSPLPGRRVIVNVGSVGQPRDRDYRSCYVEFDGATIWFRRVAYDVESTIRKIETSGELHESLGHRLREGR
jgi:diadenosine tetraphosphatase ApaH/serine/threonine PP2A family protein phosphatase